MRAQIPPSYDTFWSAVAGKGEDISIAPMRLFSLLFSHSSFPLPYLCVRFAACAAEEEEEEAISISSVVSGGLSVVILLRRGGSSTPYLRMRMGCVCGGGGRDFFLGNRIHRVPQAQTGIFPIFPQ